MHLGYNKVDWGGNATMLVSGELKATRQGGKRWDYQLFYTGVLQKKTGVCKLHPGWSS